MSDEPFKPSSVLGDDSHTRNPPGGRHLLRRSFAWLIDMSLILGGYFLLDMVLNALPAQTKELALGLKLTARLPAMFLIALASGFSLWSAFNRSPGMLVMGLDFQVPASVSRLWLIRRMRLAGPPLLFLIVGMGALSPLGSSPDGGETMVLRFSYSVLMAIAFIAQIVGPLFCLSPSGKSPLDRVFNLTVVRFGAPMR